MQFILASESARRVDLLRGVGYSFEAVRSGFPEVTRDDPRRTVQENALGKARTVAGKYPAQVVLGSDTVVYLPTEKVTYGQAATPGQSRQMISTLTGRVHEVHSGVAVVRGDEVYVRHSVTEVRIRTLSEADLDAYEALAEGVGKAGGYAIQGKAALFVEWVGGDYSNVVGLPLALTCRMLSDFGVGWYPGNSDD